MREFRLSEKALAVGDLVRFDGERYRVTRITSDGDGRSVAVVALESPSIGDTLKSEDGGIVLEELVEAVS
jgi:hypothetical protein